MLRTSFLVLSLAGLLGAAIAQEAGPRKALRQFAVQGKFFTKIDEDKDTIRIPKFALLEGHPGQYQFGGAVSFGGQLSGPGPGVPWGLRCSSRFMARKPNACKSKSASATPA